MRQVAHVVSSLHIGGAERLVVDLAGAQLRAGLAAWIIDLGRDEQPLATTARELGVRVVRVGHLRSRLARTCVLAGLLAGRDHAVHVHNPFALRAVLPLLPAVRGRVIYTRHGANPFRTTSWQLVHGLARRFVAHVTFVTDEARAAYESAHGSSPRRHLVIENGVAVAPTLALRAPGPRLRVGSVGRLVELKGQRLVLEAIAQLPPAARNRVEVHLFGDGPERERLAEHARSALPDVPVTFHGMVLDRERIYAAIDVLAVGSRTEGQSMAIMEAMARGVPAIATDVGGNPALVRDGATGLLVPVGNAPAIRDAIARLIGDPELVVRFGRASHELIAARHSIGGIAAKYDTLYTGRA